MHSQQPPGVVQNWSTLQCSKHDIERCGYDHAPVTRGRMRIRCLMALLPFQCLRLTAKILLRRQEDLTLKFSARLWRDHRGTLGGGLSQPNPLPPPSDQSVEAELTTMAWARNQQIWLRLDQPHDTRMRCEIVDNHGEPLQMSNQELYSVMVQINWTLKTQALANMQVQWRPKSAGKWHPFQWEAILHCPTVEGHRAVPSSVSRTGDCMHVWLTGRADLLRLFQRTLFRQADPVPGDAVRFLYRLFARVGSKGQAHK